MARSARFGGRPARAAEYGEFPADLNPRLREVLATRGIAQPYIHQADAWNRVGAGENVVIVTPTASGKTLCYNLPVLHDLAANTRGARFISVSHEGAFGRSA